MQLSLVKSTTMDSRLNIISRISFAPVSSIQSFNATVSGSVRLQVMEWKLIREVRGSVGFTVSTGSGKSGDLVEIKFSIKLKDPLRQPGPVIVKIEFEDSDPIIIGEKDLPVRFEFDTSLTQKTLAFSHRSWHNPYKLIQ